MADLEIRLSRLERRQRGWMLACAALAATTLLAASSNVPDVVRAGKFELVDAEGRVRAELTHEDGSTGLYIRDETGTVRLGAAQFAHGGGGYALHGPDGKGAAVLYLKGKGSLTFYDADGNVVPAE